MTFLVKRIKKYPVISVCIVVDSLFVLTTARSYFRLRGYQSFIHAQYASEIRQLEEAMRKWSPDRYDDDFAYFEAIEEIKAEIKDTFTTGVFHSAHWSYDSHHGARGTGLPPDGGMSYSQWLSTSELPRQTLSYGKTFKGKPLLVWQKWIDAPMMRHIEVVFYRDEIDRRMSDRVQ